MAHDGHKNDNFIVSNDEDRPYIAHSESSAFRVGQKVHILGSDGSLEGPYIVSLVKSSEKKCQLSLENGQVIKNGEEIEMAKLDAA
ncbi:uncharacterized protein F4807DRAFT_445543 [Annulohypoxylon truncatum]|uniref:uncharacterized protein n=1 Tax=Annulohypoxylon truncatum TaxID=327061 RepID=UPI00200743EA|nr:uncharacterized protein F4807DRAFT_445543 [Annulohypoxylon truncatum]KAI1204901.1 hypothetical protein F4807DRAFT_445543 [Annulohypoxylon truncatum]